MTRMPLFVACLAGLALLPTSLGAHADLTLNGRSGMISMNTPSIGQETLFLKNRQLRRDLSHRGRSYSYIYNLDKREVTSIDHMLRQADVHAMANPKGAPGKADSDKELKLEIGPTGQKTILEHWQCAEQKITARMPVQLGPEPTTQVLTGTAWLAHHAPEKRLVAPFSREAHDSDFFLGAPNLSAPQTQGVNAVLRRLLQMGAVCAADIQIRYEGDGRMADLGRRLETRLSLAWNSLSTTPIGDDIFAIPAGYRVIRK